MRATKVSFQILIISVGTILSSISLAQKIFVFTDSSHPMVLSGLTSLKDVKIYKMDYFNRIKDKINKAISSSTPEQSEEISKEIIAKYRISLIKAARGFELAQKYNVRSVPTVVFNNDAFQVKGQSNLSVAIQEYKKFEKGLR